MKVINLFGAPCSGKSTHAAGLFSEMKKLGYNVELGSEWIKQFFYSDNREYIPNQLLTSGKQLDQLHRLEKHVDFIIMDSPLALGFAYSTLFSEDNSYLAKAILYEFYKFDNFNIMLYPDFDYVSNGRGSIRVSDDVIKLISENVKFDIEFKESSKVSYEEIINSIKEK